MAVPLQEDHGWSPQADRVAGPGGSEFVERWALRGAKIQFRLLDLAFLQRVDFQ